MIAQIDTVKTNRFQTDYLAGQLYFKFYDEVSLKLPTYRAGGDLNTMPAFMRQLIAKYGVESLYCPFKGNRNPQEAYRVHFAEVDMTEQFIRDLEASELVRYAEKIPVYQAFFNPNDSEENDGNQGYLEQVNAYDAWDYSFGSAEVSVAILDNSIKYDHEDLLASVKVNWSDFPDNGLDDDGNGYIDDTFGYDTANDDADVRPYLSSADGIQAIALNRVDKTFSHGTHVSGVVAAATDNGIGIASIGNGVKFLPVKIGDDTNGNLSSFDFLTEGIHYAMIREVDVINISGGSDAPSITLKEKIEEAQSNSIIIVASAGNDYECIPHYPAAFPNVIAVGGVKFDDQVAYAESGENPDSVIFSGSNYGIWVDVCAPYYSIMSTVVDTEDEVILQDRYNWSSGTSFSAPIVSATCALMLSYDPTLTPEQVRSCLYASADPINDPYAEHVGELGYGRVNVAAAMACVQDTGYEDCLGCSDVEVGVGNCYEIFCEDTIRENTVYVNGEEDFIADVAIYPNLILYSSANVVCQAGQYIHITDTLLGFHAFEGSSFHAYIAPCQEVVPIIAGKKDKASTTPIALSNKQIEMDLYPNPTTGDVTLNFILDETSTVNIQLLNVNGQQVVLPTSLADEYVAGEHEVQFSVQTLPPGIYYCQLKTHENTQTAKLLVLE